jgi:hypothetical protein
MGRSISSMEEKIMTGSDSSAAPPLRPDESMPDHSSASRSPGEPAAASSAERHSEGEKPPCAAESIEQGVCHVGSVLAEAFTPARLHPESSGSRVRIARPAPRRVLFRSRKCEPNSSNMPHSDQLFRGWQVLVFRSSFGRLSVAVSGL